MSLLFPNTVKCNNHLLFCVCFAGKDSIHRNSDGRIREHA